MKATPIFAAIVLAAVAAVPANAKKDKTKEAAPQARAQAASDVVATIGSEPITQTELDKAAANQLAKLRQQEFDIKENVLDGMIQQKLLDKEAAARNIAVTDLLKTEVEDKITDPTKDEIQNFYDKNKARIGNRTLEDATADIDRALRAQKQAERRQALLKDLYAKADVKVFLDPPRADIKFPADAPALGPAGAPVTMVEYSDFQCPFCRRAYPTVEQIKQEYGDKVRFVYRDYPLAMHKQAFPASVASRCAGDQGKYWEYFKNLMTVNGDLGADDLKKRATDLGLDAAAFGACLDSKRHDVTIQASFDEGAGYGVTGTPAFFVNGRMLVGAQPFDAFKNVIEDELSRAKQAKPAAGTN